MPLGKLSVFLFAFPLRMASLKTLQNSPIEDKESSFPGTGKVTRFGSQLVSTIPTVGISIFAAPDIARCSLIIVSNVLKAMIKSGSLVIPPNFLCEDEKIYLFNSPFSKKIQDT